MEILRKTSANRCGLLLDEINNNTNAYMEKLKVYFNEFANLFIG